ncbi:MAG: site-specific DNA-methyltransferase [Mogibacterium sp.]|nr:site-specific DNA-methyltransferase [Mogibacterium sp.]
MAVIEQIMKGIQAGREDYAQLDISAAVPGDAEHTGSVLALCDNVEYMRKLLSEGYAGKFSIIYIDPPFFTRSKFNATVTVKDADGARHRIRHLAFDDRFERSLECYIENMTVRLLLMRDLLADNGLMWVHLDWHSSHYVKMVLDELMGEKNFVNEIIWCYKSGGSGKKHFSRKHDNILVYSKAPGYYIDIPQEKSYNRGFKPYNFKGVREYQDDQGWYTLVNMKDVWNVDMVGRTSSERTGYATQKPLELMKRIILAGSREGDLVGDFFCGSGSFLEAAEISGRRWMGCDNEKLAISMTRKRMIHRGADFVCEYGSDRASAGRASAKVYDRILLENGRVMYKCGIEEFKPDIDTGYIQMSDRGFIEQAIESDPMQLIDYVMINNENTEAGVIEVEFDDMTFVGNENARLTLVDIFGREYSVEMHRPSDINDRG